ncbi:MAG: hypothetical protein AAFY03_05005, partial [Pseudomonadota bacterium]
MQMKGRASILGDVQSALIEINRARAADPFIGLARQTMMTGPTEFTFTGDGFVRRDNVPTHFMGVRVLQVSEEFLPPVIEYVRPKMKTRKQGRKCSRKAWRRANCGRRRKVK